LSTVSILGCGWLGFELALILLEKENYIIKASTTTIEKTALLEKQNIIPFLINSNNLEIHDYILNDFLDCTILIIAVPPKKENKHYLTFLKQIMCHHNIPKIKQIIFISSTSVYPEDEKNYTENELIREENSSKKIVYKAEQILKNHVILRCAGLMGYDRIAGKYFANKILKDKNAPVNYVHRDDVIAAIQLIIKKEIRNNIYNLCCAKHPTKEEVYLSNVTKYGFEKPLFEGSEKEKERLIDGSKITRELGYEYIYHNPIDFI